MWDNLWKNGEIKKFEKKGLHTVTIVTLISQRTNTKQKADSFVS